MAADPSSTPEPKVIEKLAVAVFPSLAMLAGMQLDVFTPLHEGPMSAEQLAAVLRVRADRLRPLLYALVAAELLTVDGERFANTAEAQAFLVRSHPTYLGARADNFALQWQATLHTAASIRTGRPQAKIDFGRMSSEALTALYRGMSPSTLTTGHELVRRYDFSAYRTLLDVGGGAGGLAMALTEAYPQLHATVVDLPNVTPITQRLLAEAGATERVHVHTADVVHEPLTGSYEVAVMRAFIQVLSPEHARRALHHVSQVLIPGGVLYIVGQVLDDSRLSPIETVTRNLFFLNIYDDGQAYTEGEHHTWLRDAGFEGFERVPLPEGASIISARKHA
jgi:SAM-dependent methyltransferase